MSGSAEPFDRTMVVTLFERRNDTRGRRKECTWRELVHALQTEPEQSATKDGACFLFGEVVPDEHGALRHRKDQVAAIHALAVDLDDVPDEAVTDAVADLACRGLDFVGWPTHSQLAKPQHGSLRCRMVFPLSRPVTRREWDVFWSAALRDLYLDALADSQCKDESRLYFHTIPVGRAEEFRELCDVFRNEGAPLDVDAILARAPTIAEPIVARRVNLNAPELLRDGSAGVERCPLGRSPFEHAEHLARTMPPAMEGQGGSIACLRVARALVHGLQIPAGNALNLLAEHYNPRCDPAWSDAELRHKIEDASKESGAPYPRGALLPIAPDDSGVPLDALTRSHGKVEPSVANTALILTTDIRWRGVIRFDEFGNRVLCAAEPPMREHDRPSGSCLGDWTDAHSTRTRAWLSEQWEFEPGKDVLDSAVDIAARRNSFHPVKDYLRALRWDAKPRLEGLLSEYFGAEPTEYAALIGKKFMIAAVARATVPGCKVDTVLILEGKQGTKKSTAVRVLAGDAWFADTPLDLDSKDAAQCLRGKWIYEIGELHAFNRSEVTRIKAFVSSQSDNYRPSYGRRNVDFPRMCVFVGTTNGSEYLSDTTGHRRFWPVKTGAIKIDALKRDRDQLWAEAIARFAAGESWWLDSESERLAVEEQAQRESVDPWEARIAAWLAKHTGDVTTGAVLKGLGVAQEHESRAHATRVGQMLQKLGYAPKQKRLDDGRRVRVYEASQPAQP